MFNRFDINTCLSGLVGFRQPFDPCLPMLPTTLTTSESGLYVEDAHGLLTMENIAATLQEYAYSYTLYNGADVYDLGTKVIGTDNNIYLSLVANNVSNALNNTNFWQLLGAKPNFTTQLQQIYDNAIQKTLNEVMAQKTSLIDSNGSAINLSGVAKPLLLNQSLYEAPNAGARTETKNSRFVGVQIDLQNKLSVQVQLPQIGLRFTQAQSLDLYIYHTSQTSPLYKFTVNYTNANNFQWLPIDINGQIAILTHRSLVDDGGTYYIGYYEDDLVGQALTYNVEYSSCLSCGGAGNYQYLSYMCLQKYRSYVKEPRFIYVNTQDLALNKDIFTVGKVQRCHSSNFGINLKFNVYCDITSLICDNRLQFANLLQLQIAYDLLERMLMNVRNNRISEISIKNALYELKGNDNPNSITKQIERQRAGLNFTFSDLDPICLPCGQRGVVTKTM